MPIAQMPSKAPAAARWHGGGFIDRCSARNADMRFRIGRARRFLVPLLAMLPRRHRFATALRLARVVAPLATRASSPVTRLLNDGTSIALRSLCDTMNRKNVAYDIPVRVEGAAIIDEAQKLGRGLLLVTAHFNLNSLTVPWLRDRGWLVHVVRSSPDPTIVVPGRGQPLPCFVRSPQLLVGIRQALRGGALVMIAIDSPDPVASGFTLETSVPIHVSDAAPRMAARWGASVAIMSTGVAGTGMVATIRPASAGLQETFEAWFGVPSGSSALCNTTRA
jgi:lauroyl/myristoyl acyltransferase